MALSPERQTEYPNIRKLKIVGWISVALNTLKCNHLASLGLKGLKGCLQVAKTHMISTANFEIFLTVNVTLGFYSGYVLRRSSSDLIPQPQLRNRCFASVKRDWEYYKIGEKQFSLAFSNQRFRGDISSLSSTFAPIRLFETDRVRVPVSIDRAS